MLSTLAGKAIFGGVAVILAVSLFFIWLSSHDAKIRFEEREKIALALEREAKAKEKEVVKDVKEREKVIESATPDELVDYFRTGRLPKAAGGKDRPPGNTN